MPHQQDAEFVDAGGDFVAQDALVRLRDPFASGKFMDRQYRIVAGMVGVMYRRPVFRRPAAAYGTWTAWMFSPSSGDCCASPSRREMGVLMTGGPRWGRWR